MAEDTLSFQAVSSGSLLREGIAAAKSGERERARDLLVRAVARDETNAAGWLWLSGLLEDLEDRRTCLKKVLALDPGNTHARKGLAWIEGQLEAREPSQPPDKVLPFASPVGDSAGRPSRPSGAFVRSPREASELSTPAIVPETPEAPPRESTVVPRDSAAGGRMASPGSPTQSKSPSLALVAPDGFREEYACPYCAVPTEPEDQKCKACGGRLWIDLNRQRKRSVWLWAATILQALGTAAALLLLGALALAAFGPLGEALLGDLGVYGFGSPGLDDASALLSVAMLWLRVAFAIALVQFLYSALVLVGLLSRWKPAFYLFLVNAGLGLIWGVVGLVLAVTSAEATALAGALGTIYSGANLCVSVAMVWLALRIRDDFVSDRERIRVELEEGLDSGGQFLERAEVYRKLGMWALAAIHLREAVRLTPYEINPHLGLAVAYIRLRRYDLAAGELLEARRISPSEPRIEKLQTVLHEVVSGAHAA